MIELNLKLISDTTTKLAFLQSGNLEDIHTFIYNLCKWSKDNYYLRCNGHDVKYFEDINGTVQIIPRLLGGKGGFGSMLRAIGAQIEKTTNREACRDLSGRRLRDINEEQRLKKWISQQAEREREIVEKRKKKLEKLSSEPKHEFKDEVYFAERSEMGEKLSDAFEQGVQATSSCVKRKTEKEVVKPVKKNKLLIDLDDFSSSDEVDESDDDDNKDATSSCVLRKTEKEVVNPVKNNKLLIDLDELSSSDEDDSDDDDNKHIHATSSGVKRKTEKEVAKPVKKKKLLIDLDEFSSSDGSDGSDDDDNNKNIQSKHSIFTEGTSCIIFNEENKKTESTESEENKIERESPHLAEEESVRSNKVSEPA